MSDDHPQPNHIKYGSMSYQRQTANRSKTCNCCGSRIRLQYRWPKNDDPYYRGAVCPVCDQSPADE